MAWGIYRRAQDEDYVRLAEAGQRFIDRHGLGMMVRWYDGTPDQQINYLLIDLRTSHPEDACYYRRLWLRCVARALRQPGAEGIAWGSVGAHVD